MLISSVKKATTYYYQYYNSLLTFLPKSFLKNRNALRTRDNSIRKSMREYLSKIELHKQMNSLMYCIITMPTLQSLDKQYQLFMRNVGIPQNRTRICKKSH
jgi:hypothetical protein